MAFLRGVNNIGMAKRVSMADLRALFEALGFRDVRTVLNSGTVVFSVPSKIRTGVRARIATGLATKLDLEVQVTVLAGKEIVAAVRENPLDEIATDPSRLLVVVLHESADRDRLRPLLQERWTPERLAVGRRCAYLWCAKGVADSQLWPKVDRALQRSGTARNLGTMRRILALVDGPPT